MSSSNTQVSLNLRLTSDGEDSNWFTALTIPLDLFRLYTVKPRKWLSYLGYAVTGSEGVLSLAYDDSESIPCDMGDPVNAGDIYYFHATNTTHFVDPDVISTVPSDCSSRSLSPIPNGLISQYGVCPFTEVRWNNCEACYLIPQYIRHSTQERSEGLKVVKEVDDIRNMLLLAPDLNRYVGSRKIAFLQTPNAVLKSNDIVQDADPEAYFITLHCFVEDDPVLFARANHGKSVALLNEDTRPPEVLCAMIYGSAAINAWAPSSALALVKRYTQDTYYPGDTGKARRERKEKQARERCERLRSWNEDRSEEMSEDEESDDFDEPDMVVAFRCATQKKSEDLTKAEEDERKKASAEKVEVWLAGR
ncbi:hypothetical protein M0805_001366 [Coniferiporia weirii]|nr:hypothetical protein M0805_001366 [Coniferiporia weirii]